MGCCSYSGDGESEGGRSIPMKPVDGRRYGVVGGGEAEIASELGLLGLIVIGLWLDMKFVCGLCLNYYCKQLILLAST